MTSIKRFAIAAMFTLGFVGAAFAQQPQRFETGPNGNFAPGVVLLCLGADGVSAAPCAQAQPLATQQTNALRVTRCPPNKLTGVVPPLCPGM